MVLLVDGEPIKQLSAGVRKKIPVPAPPVPDQLHTWFDFSDLSTLFQDIPGIIPVTDIGQNIGYIANKGTLGPDLPSLGTFATLVDGPTPATKAANLATAAAYQAASVGFAANTDGACIAVAWRPNVLNTPANAIWGLDHLGLSTDDFGADTVMNALRTTTSGGGLIVLFSGAVVAVPLGTYQAGYYTANPAVGSPDGDGHRYLAPGPGGSLNDALDPSILDVAAANMLFQLGTPVWDIDVLEILLYFRHLIAAEQADLAAYFDAKYEELPHV